MRRRYFVACDRRGQAAFISLPITHHADIFLCCQEDVALGRLRGCSERIGKHPLSARMGALDPIRHGVVIRYAGVRVIRKRRIRVIFHDPFAEEARSTITDSDQQTSSSTRLSAGSFKSIHREHRRHNARPSTQRTQPRYPRPISREQNTTADRCQSKNNFEAL